jgi:ATP-dependent exoDNAse (exonuclease V) beta subunit
MTNLSVTNLINTYKVFSRNFWLSYKALEAIMVPSEFEKIKMTLMKSKWIDPKIFERVDKNAFELKKAEIDLEWKKKSEDARNTGIAVHDKIHNMLVTDLPECQRCFGIPTDKYGVAAVEKFQTESGIFPEFRMEVPLDDEYQLVGVADLIIKDGNDITIIDFKTDEKIETSARFDMGKMKKKCLKYPLSKLEDCALVHYQLQLSLYAWLVKQINPEFNIVSLEIMHIKDGKLKKTYPVEYLEKETETLIKWHLKATRLKKETDKCKELNY